VKLIKIRIFYQVCLYLEKVKGLKEVQEQLAFVQSLAKCVGEFRIMKSCIDKQAFELPVEVPKDSEMIEETAEVVESI